MSHLEATLHGDLEAMNRAVLASGNEEAWCEGRMRENRIVAVLTAFDQRDVVTVERLVLEVAEDREQLEILLEKKRYCCTRWRSWNKFYRADVR